MRKKEKGKDCDQWGSPNILQAGSGRSVTQTARHFGVALGGDVRHGTSCMHSSHTLGRRHVTACIHTKDDQEYLATSFPSGQKKVHETHGALVKHFFGTLTNSMILAECGLFSDRACPKSAVQKSPSLFTIV